MTLDYQLQQTEEMNIITIAFFYICFGKKCGDVFLVLKIH